MEFYAAIEILLLYSVSYDNEFVCVSVCVCGRKMMVLWKGGEIQSDCMKYMYMDSYTKKNNNNIEAIKYFEWAGFKLHSKSSRVFFQ